MVRAATGGYHVPLQYAPGDLGQVDFFEVLVDLGGERVKAWMFVVRLMHSGRDFAWLYPRQDQVSFIDGHVRAFEHFGAVPHRLAYDNLKAAVKRILVGSERELGVAKLTDQFQILFFPKNKLEDFAIFGVVFDQHDFDGCVHDVPFRWHLL